MADIVIRGMEMPTNCGECAFLRRLEKPILYTSPFWCCINGLEVIKQEKNRYCPLVPLPEGHGRLIDADNLKKAVHESRSKNPHMDGKIKSNHDYEHLHFLGMIYDAPTILEAEGGDVDG